MDLFSKCKALYEKIRYFEYGIPVDGVIKGVPSAEYFVKNYHFLKPEEFEKYGGGICWDYVEYERKFLEVNDIDFNQYYLITNTPPNYDTHTFITVKDGNDLIYIESSFKRVEHIIDGVQKFKSLEDIVKLITTNMWYCNDNDKHFDEFRYDVCKFKGHPQYGCTCEEYMKWMDDNSDIVIQDVSINPKKINNDELPVEEFSVNKIDTKFNQFVCESVNDPEEYDETLHDHINDEDDIYNESFKSDMRKKNVQLQRKNKVTEMNEMKQAIRKHVEHAKDGTLVLNAEEIDPKNLPKEIKFTKNLITEIPATTEERAVKWIKRKLENMQFTMDLYKEAEKEFKSTNDYKAKDRMNEYKELLLNDNNFLMNNFNFSAFEFTKPDVKETLMFNQAIRYLAELVNKMNDFNIKSKRQEIASLLGTKYGDDVVIMAKAGKPAITWNNSFSPNYVDIRLSKRANKVYQDADKSMFIHFSKYEGLTELNPGVKSNYGDFTKFGNGKWFYKNPCVHFFAFRMGKFGAHITKQHLKQLMDVYGSHFYVYKPQASDKIYYDVMETGHSSSIHVHGVDAVFIETNKPLPVKEYSVDVFPILNDINRNKNSMITLKESYTDPEEYDEALHDHINDEDDVYNESYIGEATVPSGKVAFLYKKWSTKNKEQFNTLDVFWDIINKYIKDHNIPISNVCGYGTDWTGYGTDFVYGIFFKNQQTIPNDLLETMKKKIPDIKVKDLNIPTKFDGYETCPNSKMEQTYDKIWDKGFLMYELEEYPDDDTIKIHYKYKVLYSENEEWNKRWEEYKKNKKPVSINESWTDFKNGVHPSSNLMFHVSLKNDMDGKTITPQLPSYITDGGELDDNYQEDTKTKRLCVSPSIEGCLIAILSYNKIREHVGDKFYVYTPEKPFSQYKHKTNKEIVKDKLVFDANITKEAWILEPCKLKLYGIIKLKKVKDLKKKPTVEKGIKMNTIKLDYEWIMTPKASGKFNKAIGDSPDDESDKKEKPIKEYDNILVSNEEFFMESQKRRDSYLKKIKYDPKTQTADTGILDTKTGKNIRIKIKFDSSDPNGSYYHHGRDFKTENGNDLNKFLDTAYINIRRGDLNQKKNAGMTVFYHEIGHFLFDLVRYFRDHLNPSDVERLMKWDAEVEKYNASLDEDMVNNLNSHDIKPEEMMADLNATSNVSRQSYNHHYKGYHNQNKNIKGLKKQEKILNSKIEQAKANKDSKRLFNLYNTKDIVDSQNQALRENAASTRNRLKANEELTKRLNESANVIVSNDEFFDLTE